MGKKLLSLLMAIVICFTSLNTTASANEDNLVKVNENNIEELIEIIALAWAEMIEPELKFTVSDIIRIDSIYTNEIEYTASLFCEAVPYGYIVIGFDDNSAVVKEANISRGKEGLYTEIVDRIVENTDEPRKKLDIDEIITKLAPLQYSLSYEDSSGNIYAMDNYGNDLSSEEELLNGTKKYGSAYEIYISKDNWSPSKYLTDPSSMVILKKYSARYTLKSEKYIKDITHKYACGVQALLQIAYMERLIEYSPGNIQDTYNKLWNYCKITQYDEYNGISYGEGTTDNAENGFLRYAKEAGYVNTDSAATNNPTVLWITDKLLRNYPVYMAYGINVNGSRSGHAISILGYRKAKASSDGKTYDFLQVYNSWDDTYAFLNYSTTDFTDCRAVCFDVRK